MDPQFAPDVIWVDNSEHNATVPTPDAYSHGNPYAHADAYSHGNPYAYSYAERRA